MNINNINNEQLSQMITLQLISMDIGLKQFFV